MQQWSHYTHLTVLPLEGVSASTSDINLMIDKIMQAVHLSIASGIVVAVGFPDMSTENDLPSLGRSIRIFGRQANLEQLFVFPDFNMLLTSSSISTIGAPIRETPPATNWEVYKRNRKNDNIGPSRLRRRLRRSGGQLAPIDGIIAIRRKYSAPYFIASSRSTGQRYSILVNRFQADPSIENMPDSYGLGAVLPVL